MDVGHTWHDFSTRAAQIQDIWLCNWNNRTTGLLFSFCFFFLSPLSPQSTERSVQTNNNPEAANKDRVGCLTLADKVTSWHQASKCFQWVFGDERQKQASRTPTLRRTLRAVTGTLATLEWINANVIRRSDQVHEIKVACLARLNDKMMKRPLTPSSLFPGSSLWVFRWSSDWHSLHRNITIVRNGKRLWGACAGVFTAVIKQPSVCLLWLHSTSGPLFLLQRAELPTRLSFISRSSALLLSPLHFLEMH